MDNAADLNLAQTLAAAEAADRLLADPYLTGALNELQQQSANKALFGEKAVEREDARQQVIAIDRLRGALRDTLAYGKIAKQAEADAESFE